MEITKELLKQKFEEYNKLYFNNELPMCTFSYNYMRDAFGRYTTHTKSNGRKIDFRNEKPKVTFSRKVIAFLRNQLHLF